ncbi:MAG: DUF6431 domain-containing protein [Clostridia bacterium]|nr:DUF6431 domain-containing protein [Clostridia bacterium]
MHTVEELVRRCVVICPLCGGPLTVHCCYRRHIRDGNGSRHDGWIAQGKCETCKKYPSLIPEFIMPYKHFEAAVIEAAIWEVEEKGDLGLSSCPADESTIRRWIHQFGERGAQAVGWLLSILYAVYDERIGALELQNKGLLKQLARLAREIPAPETDGTISRVNIILTSHNAGFL